MDYIFQTLTAEKVIFPIFIITALIVAYAFGEKIWQYYVAAFIIVSRLFSVEMWASIRYMGSDIGLSLLLFFIECFLFLFSLALGLRLREKKWTKKYVVNTFLYSGIGTLIAALVTLIIKAIFYKKTHLP